jgi:hypothetical protein
MSKEVDLTTKHTKNTKGWGSRLTVGELRLPFDFAILSTKQRGRRWPMDMNRAVESVLSCPSCVSWFSNLEGEVVR